MPITYKVYNDGHFIHAIATNPLTNQEFIDYELVHATDKRIKQLCDENDIPFLALEPLFRIETEKGRRLHFPINGHWNPEGNDLAGRLMAEFLLGFERVRETEHP